MSYSLPELPYAYDALEPYFDMQTMTIHHQRHHQAYIDNLNKAIAGTELEKEQLENILKNVSRYSPAVRNNGGGHYNHSLFWTTLSPEPKTSPQGKLQQGIDTVFGGLDALKAELKKAGLGQFGSGWAWLMVKFNGGLEIAATPNQDNPLMDSNIAGRGYPILGIDVWEHAYYLQYRNKRADYLDAFWSVLDWEAVETNFNNALAKI